MWMREAAQDDPNSDLMSLDEIWAAKNINKEVVREAYSQVSQLLADMLEAKRTFDQKALSLFTAYVTVALAPFGLAVGAANAASPIHDMFGPLCGIGVLFSIGAFLFVAALRDADYGMLGSAPGTWLREDVLQSDNDDMVHRVMASVVRRYQERLVISAQSNASKTLLIRAGMIVGALAPLCVLAFALFRAL
jgi:hypothetical protein